MTIFSRIIIALNQSFRLLFVSIYNGGEFVFRSIQKTIRILSRSIKKLHEALATLIQLIINISSLVFVLFIPIVFFLDPLDWSRHLTGLLSWSAIFWCRMVLGGFFSLVAYFLVTNLIKSWQDSAAIIERSNGSARGDLVRGIADLVSWMLILVIFVYFAIFRFQLLPIDLRKIELPPWLRALMPP